MGKGRCGREGRAGGASRRLIEWQRTQDERSRDDGAWTTQYEARIGIDKADKTWTERTHKTILPLAVYD